MKTPPRIFVIIGIVFVSVVGGLLIQHRIARPHHELAHARYYCPMHPTYTSDRPGNCPICSMKLVKAEVDRPSNLAGANPSPNAQVHAADKLTSICYLHNCPKLHGGKPCPMTVVAKPGEKVICPICGSHIAEAAPQEAVPTARRILYWTDPMIPGYQSDKPGKSPMGMDLVPVYEEAGTLRASDTTPPGYAPILLTPEKQQLVGVKTAPAKKQPLTKTIRTVGVIAHDPELYQAQQEFIQAYQAWKQASAMQPTAVADQAKQLVDSSRFRLRHLGLSEELIDEMTTWTQPDHRLLLGGAGECWVYASIYEYELPLVHAGQVVTVEVSAFPGRVFTGTLKAVDPMLDPMTRTTRARILVDDPEGLLKPSMYVNVSIAVNLGEVISVPEEAVFSTGEQQIVFVDKGQGLFEPRSVVLGAKADGSYEIKVGVSEGEFVVTSGNFLIDSESRLKGALQGSGSHQHGQ